MQKLDPGYPLAVVFVSHTLQGNKPLLIKKEQ
jgi:hypothetical protein